MYEIGSNISELPNILKKINDSNIKVVETNVDQAGSYGVDVATSKAHRISGLMASKIKKEKVSAEEVKVVVEVDYAVYENARGGNHAFFDQAYDATKAKYPNLLFSEIIKGVKASHH